MSNNESIWYCSKNNKLIIIEKKVEDIYAEELSNIVFGDKPNFKKLSYKILENDIICTITLHDNSEINYIGIL